MGKDGAPRTQVTRTSGWEKGCAKITVYRDGRQGGKRRGAKKTGSRDARRANKGLKEQS